MKKSIPYNGKTYQSVTELCRDYGITTNLFYSRIRNGWEMEDALNRPLNYCKKVVQDHDGNMFSSVEKMANHYGISRILYYHRIRNGMTKKEALTTPLAKPTYRHAHSCEDGVGNRFHSIAEMCKYHNVPIMTYRSRLKAGKSIKEALGIEKQNEKTIL